MLGTLSRPTILPQCPTLARGLRYPLLTPEKPTAKTITVTYLVLIKGLLSPKTRILSGRQVLVILTHTKATVQIWYLPEVEKPLLRVPLIPKMLG